MKQRSLFSSTALALAFAVTPAFADVTAKDVWQLWQDQVGMIDELTLSGDEAMSTDGLSVSNATYAGTFAIEGEELQFSATMPDISFVENGDGTVSVTMPDTYELPIRVTVDGTNVDVVLDVVQTGFEMTASGTPEELVQEYSAPMVQMSIASIPMADMVGAEIEGSLLVSGSEGRIVRVDGELPTISSESSATAMVINFNVVAPEDEGGGELTVNLTASELESRSTGSLGSIGMMSDVEMLSEMLANGLSSSGAGSVGTIAFDVNFEDGNDTVQASGTVGSSSYEIDFSKDKAAYLAENKNITLNLLTSEFPLPVEIALLEFGAGVNVPLSKSDEEQDFGVSLNIGDLIVNDAIWGLADPGAVLPREPITARFDISGAAQLFVDLFDLEQVMSAGIPGQLNNIALTDLLLKGAGAEISGNGAFTIDNAKMDPMTGMPTPVGELSLRAEGLNGLIDNLIGMGLLPEEDAMGARMMMGMFAISEGDDVLTTNIQAGEDGSISANGQRIK